MMSKCFMVGTAQVDLPQAYWDYKRQSSEIFFPVRDRELRTFLFLTMAEHTFKRKKEVEAALKNEEEGRR